MAVQNVSNNEIDLVRVIKVLIKKKWLIILGTLLTTLAAVLISLMLPRVYKSDGFFQLSSGIDIDMDELKKIQDEIREDLQNNMLSINTLQKNMLLNEALGDSNLEMKNVSIPSFKKYLSKFTNPQQFLKFMGSREKSGDENLKELKASIRSSDDIAQWLEPVYAYSKKDMKDLLQSSRDVKNFVLGVRVAGENQTPQKAQLFVSVIGEFIKDSILYGKIKSYIASQLNKNKTEAKKYENYIINDRFKLEQLLLKRGRIEGVLKKYPQFRAMTGRELYSLENSGYRYLSPAAQLVGIESYIADINENLARNQRNKQLVDLKYNFLSAAKKILDSEIFGGAVLGKCMELKDAFFAKKDSPADVTREAGNDVAIDFDNFVNLKEEMQFISGPTLPARPIKPRKALIVVISFIIAFFIFVVLAFFIDWWKYNRKKIKNDEK